NGCFSTVRKTPVVPVGRRSIPRAAARAKPPTSRYTIALLALPARARRPAHDNVRWTTGSGWDNALTSLSSSIRAFGHVLVRRYFNDPPAGRVRRDRRALPRAAASGATLSVWMVGVSSSYRTPRGSCFAPLIACARREPAG